MGLNIKNEGTHRLVRELARMTGQSQTSAVEDAVRRRIAELAAAETKVDRILSIAADFQADLTPDQRAALQHADEQLYDDRGLPR